MLADPDRLATFIDAVSNAFALAADDSVAVPFAAVVEVAKQLATGVVSGLDGLTAMRPGGDFLQGLKAAAERTVAIGSHFRALEGASLAARAAGAVADTVFGEPNDLVVPTSGADVVPDPMVLAGVTHTGFFREQAVRSLIAGVCDG